MPSSSSTPCVKPKTLNFGIPADRCDTHRRSVWDCIAVRAMDFLHARNVVKRSRLRWTLLGIALGFFLGVLVVATGEQLILTGVLR